MSLHISSYNGGGTCSARSRGRAVDGEAALETAHDAVRSDSDGQHVEAEQSYRRVVALLAGVGAMLPPQARARAEQLVHAYEERLSADVFGQPGRGAAAVAPSRRRGATEAPTHLVIKS